MNAQKHSGRLAQRSQRRAPRGARGVVLLEALVGILIFTIGVLGLIGVQLAMTRAQTEANFRVEAAQLASDVVGLMWVDVANIDKYFEESTCKSHSQCKEWQDRVFDRLPGKVPPQITSKDGQIEIVIGWVSPGEKDNGGRHQFRTTTSISH